MAPTQAALYDGLSEDLHLSWSEAELPERERTKHVHRLHPYLGKFVPQLVEALLDRYVKPGGRVLDPFAGSGTTLVQCLESGYDAVGHRHRRLQLPAHAREDRRYDLFQLETRSARRARAARPLARAVLAAMSASGSRRGPPPSSSTSARSSTTTSTPTSFASCSRARRGRRRLTTHFDLDFPRVPQREPYWCHKHRRDMRAGPGGRQVPRPLPPRHARADQGLPEACGPGRAARRPPRRLRPTSRSAEPSTRSSPRRPIRA